MKIGIIREGKIPTDNRVALTPEQCQLLIERYKCEVSVEPSPHRCYSDAEYQSAGINLTTELNDCDFLLGIKEIPVAQLIPNKTYLFFSHTIKKQSYNKKLLQSILAKKIKLVDYEVLKNDKDQRLIAFGKFAGMVGAHNSVLGYGERTGLFTLPRLKSFLHYEDAVAVYKKMVLPPFKIVLTGHGRVATGAIQVLLDMGIEQINPYNFLFDKFDKPVFTQLKPEDYAARTDNTIYKKADFYSTPEKFTSVFAPYYRIADVFVNGIYYEKNAPAFFSLNDMQQQEFKIKVIADISCDLVPNSSIPATIRATTIEIPFFGFNPSTKTETGAFDADAVTMMAVDNLPNELPRDASRYFGEQLLEHILPELIKTHSEVISNATVAENGYLTPNFKYLEEFVKRDEIGEMR